MEFGFMKNEKIDRIIENNKKGNVNKREFQIWVGRNIENIKGKQITYICVTETETTHYFYTGITEKLLKDMPDDRIILMGYYDQNNKLKQYYQTTAKDLKSDKDTYLTNTSNNKSKFRFKKAKDNKRILITIELDYSEWNIV